MTKGHKGRPPGEDDVVVLDDEGGGDDLARALAEAERAVASIEERHRGPHLEPETCPGSREVDEPAAGGARSGLAGPPPDDRLVADLQRRVDEERTRAGAAEEEAGRLREALMRTVADFENLKRRTEREKAEYTRWALADALRDLLSVLDNLERAVAHAADGTGEEFREGVAMVTRQFVDALRRQGAVEVSALGEPFDPNFHQAVMRVETADVPGGTVLEVFQKGYMLNERLLRPAMVKVSAAPKATAPAENSGAEGQGEEG